MILSESMKIRSIRQGISQGGLKGMIQNGLHIGRKTQWTHNRRKKGNGK